MREIKTKDSAKPGAFPSYATINVYVNEIKMRIREVANRKDKVTVFTYENFFNFHIS